MSFPYGHCSIAFTVAVRVAYKFTSPFAFLPIVHTCTNIRSHCLTDWGSQAVRPEEISPLLHFLAGGQLRKKRGEKKTSIANYPWILCSGRFRNLFCRLLIIVCVQNIYQVPGDHNRHKPSLCLNVPSTEPFQSPDTYNRVPIQQEDGCSLYCVCKFCLTYH